jgi:AcrR family transcriptional regulator
MNGACSPRTKLAGRTRQKILDAALRVFATHGYAGGSTRIIVKVARVTKPALYYHFGNKAGLFRAVVDRADNQLLKPIRAAATGDLNARDQLVAICAAMFQFAGDHPEVMAVATDLWAAAREPGPSGKHCLGKARHFLGLIQAVMERGVAEGTLHNQFSSQQLAAGFLGVLHFHVLFHLANPRHRLTRPMAEQAVTLFWEGAGIGSARHSLPGSPKPERGPAGKKTD